MSAEHGETVPGGRVVTCLLGTIREFNCTSSSHNMNVPVRPLAINNGEARKSHVGAMAFQHVKV